jgi:hypothetical protein
VSTFTPAIPGLPFYFGRGDHKHLAGADEPVLPLEFARARPISAQALSPPADTNQDSLQGAEVLRDINGVWLQYGQVDHLQRSGIGRGQYHRRSHSGIVGLKPTLRDHAPAVTGLQTRKAVLGHRRDQIIADAPLLLEEFRGENRAHQMDCLIRPAGAAAIAIEAGHWVCTAGLQFAAEDVGFTLHTFSVACRSC